MAIAGSLREQGSGPARRRPSPISAAGDKQSSRWPTSSREDDRAASNLTSTEAEIARLLECSLKALDRDFAILGGLRNSNLRHAPLILSCVQSLSARTLARRHPEVLPRALQHDSVAVTQLAEMITNLTRKVTPDDGDPPHALHEDSVHPIWQVILAAILLGISSVSSDILFDLETLSSDNLPFRPRCATNFR